MSGAPGVTKESLEGKERVEVRDLVFLPISSTAASPALCFHIVFLHQVSFEQRLPHLTRIEFCLSSKWQDGDPGPRESYTGPR